MLSKKGFFAFLCIFLWPLLVYPQHCVFLGSHPSLIVKFKDISSHQQPNLKPQLIQGLSSANATFLSARAMSGDAYVIFFSPGKSMQASQISPGCFSQSSIEELIKELKSKENIEYIDPNILMSMLRINKPFITPVIDPIQWNLLTPPGGIDAQTAFNTTTGNSNSITAVLDSGILPNNSLTPNLLQGATFNNSGTTYTVGASPSCDSSCEGYDHGTHVTGIVAASGVLAYGKAIYGVAPTSHILPINVFTKYTDNVNCNGSPPCLKSSTNDQVNALNWLNGTTFSGLPLAPYVTTVNMSLGGEGSCATSIQQAFNNLISKNVSFAVAAGNGTSNDGIPIDAINETPANCMGVMPIAATGPVGYGASYSNYGNIISFAAPGGDLAPSANQIYSTIENGYGYKSGTSMATPHVAGLSALLYSIDPTLTPTALLNIIKTTTTPFPTGGPGYSCTVTKPCGTGIINAASAVAAAISRAPILTWSDNLTVTQNSITQVTVSWSAATWNPSRTTNVIYTVNKDGSDISTCTGIANRTCILSNLTPNGTYTVYVSATDYRRIYTSIQTPSKQFTVTIIPPVLSVATRNPLRATQAYIYYTNIGNAIADSYTVNGLPVGVTLTLDIPNNRFIINNLTSPNQIDNVSITGSYDGVLSQSNSISIPRIIPPILDVAARDPLKTTQAYIYYTSLGNAITNSFTISGLPNGALISLDSKNDRFIVSNITTPKKIDNVHITGNYDGLLAATNSISIPSIL